MFVCVQKRVGHTHTHQQKTTDDATSWMPLLLVTHASASVLMLRASFLRMQCSSTDSGRCVLFTTDSGRSLFELRGVRKFGDYRRVSVRPFAYGRSSPAHWNAYTLLVCHMLACAGPLSMRNKCARLSTVYTRVCGFFSFNWAT